MLSNKNRFHGLGSLNFVLRRGSQVRSKNCALKYSVNNKRKDFRLSVVVSKKVDKSAVVRNKIRRRVYEVVREQTDNIDKPYDLAIIVYSDVLAANNYADLQKEIVGLLKKAEIL